MKLKTKLVGYVSQFFLITGVSMSFTQELIQNKFPKIAKIWNFGRMLVIFIGFLSA